jgi:hypothetical protein
METVKNLDIVAGNFYVYTWRTGLFVIEIKKALHIAELEIINNSILDPAWL